MALKFIAGPELGDATLARFRNEVRVARHVSHPNVIGFVEGTHFLSMEYLDGEDLGSLLRRIGRLPQAIEFASRQIRAFSLPLRISISDALARRRPGIFPSRLSTSARRGREATRRIVRTRSSGGRILADTAGAVFRGERAVCPGCAFSIRRDPSTTCRDPFDTRDCESHHRGTDGTAHLRSGRSDRRGAAVLGGAFVPFMIAWLLSAGHVTSVGAFALFFEGLSAAISGAMLVWLVYVAIEPHVRRNWPDSLISWTRLGRGRLGDPLVAWHVLAGLTAGAIFEYIVLPGGRLILSSSLVEGHTWDLNILAGPAQNLALVCQAFLGFLTLSLLFLIVVVVLRFITRRLWIADVVGSFLLFGPLGLGIFGGQSTVEAAAGFLTLAAAALHRPPLDSDRSGRRLVVGDSRRGTPAGE